MSDLSEGRERDVFAGLQDRITKLEAQLAEAQLFAENAKKSAAALFGQGGRAGIEEAARYVQANYPFDKRDLVPAIRALLAPERDTKADRDEDDGA